MWASKKSTTSTLPRVIVPKENNPALVDLGEREKIVFQETLRRFANWSNTDFPKSLPFGALLFQVEGSSDMSAAPTERPYPDHMYVDIPTITKTTSAIVLLICIFSLVVYGMTGVRIIQPLISVVVGFVSGMFYGMGEMLGRSKALR